MFDKYSASVISIGLLCSSRSLFAKWVHIYHTYVALVHCRYSKYTCVYVPSYSPSILFCSPFSINLQCTLFPQVTNWYFAWPFSFIHQWAYWIRGRVFGHRLSAPTWALHWANGADLVTSSKYLLLSKLLVGESPERGVGARWRARSSNKPNESIFLSPDTWQSQSK